MLSFYIKFSPLGCCFLFFFYPEKLNLEVVSVYQGWLLCLCVCMRLNIRRKGGSVASEKSIAREPVQLLRYFPLVLGISGSLARTR